MNSTPFSRAQAVADAVLYEGYALYPYRASARKNQLRWQFGVIVPAAYHAVNPAEPDRLMTMCLLQAPPDAQLTVRARFLQVEAKQVEARGQDGSFTPVSALQVGGMLLVTWDEGVEQVVDASTTLADVLTAERTLPFRISGQETAELLTDADSGITTGRVVRVRQALFGTLSLDAVTLSDVPGTTMLQVKIANLTPWHGSATTPRSEIIRWSLLGVHFLLHLEGGEFVSLIDPPPALVAAAQRCQNQGLWPVLVGEPNDRSTVLAAPIILYDYPQIAPESPQPLFDGTEIDELLTLRTLLLTEAEKQEARATDPRIANLLDRIETMTPEALAQLHGAIRGWRPLTQKRLAEVVSPVRPGQRVRLHPRLGHADAQDVFLAGKVAVIEEVRPDVTGQIYLGVTLVDDPDADLLREWGRFRYFTLDEVELLEEGEGT